MPYQLANDATKQATYHVYLFEQIAMGKVTLIESLLKGGVPVNILDSSKLCDSTLHWACSFGNEDVAATLISWGCDPNIKNADLQALNYTALQLYERIKASNFRRRCIWPAKQTI